MKKALILLAGGASSRMGSPKQLLEFEGKSLLRYAAEAAKIAEADYLLLVTGAFHDELVAEVSDLGFEITRNTDWESGLSSSIKAGIQAIEKMDQTTSMILIMLSDQPLVTASHLKDLFGMLEEQEEIQIAASSYGGKPGVPAAFRQNLFDKLKSLKGDKGAQQLFMDTEYRLELIRPDSLLIDIDSAADYDKLVKLNKVR